MPKDTAKFALAVAALGAVVLVSNARRRARVTAAAVTRSRVAAPVAAAVADAAIANCHAQGLFAAEDVERCAAGALYPNQAWTPKARSADSAAWSDLRTQVLASYGTPGSTRSLG